MLDSAKIDEIAREVATANLSGQAVTSVSSRPFIDSEGASALRITIIVTPESVNRITGDETLRTLVDIQTKLFNAGEERFPLVEYATEEELRESDHA
jgi:hypothetical protein